MFFSMTSLWFSWSITEYYTEQFKFVGGKRHRRKNDQLTVYSVAKLVSIQQVHTEVHSKTSMAGQWNQGVDGPYLSLQ